MASLDYLINRAYAIKRDADREDVAEKYDELKTVCKDLVSSSSEDYHAIALKSNIGNKGQLETLLYRSKYTSANLVKMKQLVNYLVLSIGYAANGSYQGLAEMLEYKEVQQKIYMMEDLLMGILWLLDKNVDTPSDYLFYCESIEKALVNTNDRHSYDVLYAADSYNYLRVEEDEKSTVYKIFPIQEGGNDTSYLVAMVTYVNEVEKPFKFNFKELPTLMRAISAIRNDMLPRAVEDSGAVYITFDSKILEDFQFYMRTTLDEFRHLGL
ncbi:hypothetical protein [Viridibacillus arvi]|uniref:hypothetical protein n=1 Tax=Viridibacillus arvi TaxID=263475 RepID=UPI003D00F6D7